MSRDEQLLHPATGSDIELLRVAVKDESFVFLDGFHAVKHAMRFGADMLLVATSNPGKLYDLGRSLAPDIAERLIATARTVRRRDIESLGIERSHWTGVWGVARRLSPPGEGILSSRGASPLVLLEDPSNLGNLGACIRVAAAAGAAGIIIRGDADPWEPAAVRGAAGLQFAIPVLNVQAAEKLSPPIVALDPDGDELRIGAIPPGAILAFGTEREGLSDELMKMATSRLRLPMREGVSSLNLAVAVGIVLYVWKLGHGIK